MKATRKDWEAVGFYETAQHKQVVANVRNAILAGRLVAITGPTGVGKTMMLNRIQAELATDNKFIVARSLSIEKTRLLLPALMTALFLDISTSRAIWTRRCRPSRRNVSGCFRSCFANRRSRSCCSSTRRTTCTATR